MNVIPVHFRSSPPPSHSGRVAITPILSATMLGATLYVPANRPDLGKITSGQKYPLVRSLILCTEDALHDQEVEAGLDQLAALFPQLAQGPPFCFVRPRSPGILQRLLQMDGIERVQGFVLPKFGLAQLNDWLRVWGDRQSHWLMPILETVEAFDRRAMEDLRDRLEDSGLRKQILCLRIGGNDLFNLLGLRRARGKTLYDTPLRGVVADLVCVFHPAGYRLSAPVFDRLDTPEVLVREVELDLQHGLVGKTAIHPAQVPVIEDLYRVSREDYELAVAALAPKAPAVFKLHNTFCEPVTHRRWATNLLERAQVFGIAG